MCIRIRKGNHETSTNVWCKATWSDGGTSSYTAGSTPNDVIDTIAAALEGRSVFPYVVGLPDGAVFRFDDKDSLRAFCDGFLAAMALFPNKEIK